jgi:hypothetical protein
LDDQMRQERVAEYEESTLPRLRAAAPAFAEALTRHWRLYLMAAGVVVAALGQAAMSRDFDADLGVIADPARYLRDVYPAHPRSVLFGALLLLVGGIVFALGTLRRPDMAAPFMPEADARSPRGALWSRRNIGAGAAGALGLILWLWLIWRLLGGHYDERYVTVFWASIALIGIAVVAARWITSARLRFSLRWWEPVVVAAAVTFFLVTNARDIDAWLYHAIGDEYPFFAYARQMSDGHLTANVFSQLGVWNQRPVGTSAFQAWTMDVFGSDTFGWRVATPIALAAAVPAVYIAARELFDGRVATFATLIFATSHYLTSYAHTGYDNIFAITPFAWCIALAVVGLRRASPGWMYAAGIVGGLGFYTFPTARMAPVVLVLFIATLGPRAWKPGTLLPLAIGLAIAGLPLFATDGWDAISVSRDRTVFGFTDHPTEGVAIRITENIPRTLLGFSYNPDAGHFVSGSLLDPVTAVLLVLGLAWSIANIARPAHRLLALWLIVTLAFAGILSPYDRVAYDRLHLALPVVAMYGAIAAAALVRAAAEAAPRMRYAAPAIAVGALVVLAPLLAYMNLHRFLVDSPQVIPSTEERVALGGLDMRECRDAAPAIAIVRTPAPLLAPTLAAYGWDGWTTTRPVTEAMTAGDYAAYGCAVVTVLREPTSQEVSGEVPRTCHESCWREATTTVERLEDEFGYRRVGSVTQGAAHFEAVVLIRDDHQASSAPRR